MIDNFLVYFIAAAAGMDKKIDLAAKKYKQIIQEMPTTFFPLAGGMFINGKALMEDGLLRKYLHHTIINQRSVEEKEYLTFLLANPWRYVFGRIVSRPANDFFVIRDEILGDELLLYSPGIGRNCQDGYEHSLYFLLLGNNGECWQTSGLIISFLSFDIDDIYVYATEVFPNVADEEIFMKSVYADPFPYFMLQYGQSTPMVISGNNVLRHFVAEQDITELDIATLSKYCTVQWNKGIFKISINKWSEPPHYASAYYVEKEHLLYRYAMTNEGFTAMTGKLLEAGLPQHDEGYYSVGLSMVNTMNRILKREFSINPYEKLFPEYDESTPSNDNLDQIKKFLDLLIPYINVDEQPDIMQLAAECDINPNDAEDLYKQLKHNFGK